MEVQKNTYCNIYKKEFAPTLEHSDFEDFLSYYVHVKKIPRTNHICYKF